MEQHMFITEKSHAVMVSMYPQTALNVDETQLLVFESI